MPSLSRSSSSVGSPSSILGVIFRRSLSMISSQDASVTPSTPSKTRWKRALEKFQQTKYKDKAITFYERVRSYLLPLTWSRNKKHILNYVPGIVFSYAYVYTLYGTVIQYRTIGNIMVYLGIVTVYAIGMCSSACDSEYNSGIRLDASCVNNFGTPSCFSFVDLNTGLVFNALGAFLLAIFVSITLDRWWQVRLCISSIVGGCNNLSMLAASHFVVSQEGVPNPEAIIIRENLLRYCIAAQALVYNQASCGKKGFNDIVESGYLTSQEAMILQTAIFPSKYMLVYGWCTELLKQAKINTVLSDWEWNQMQTMINDMRSSSARIFTLTGTQIPYTYVHVVTLVCKVHQLLISLHGGSVVGESIHEDPYTGRFSTEGILYGYLIVSLNSLLFEGLLQLHDQLHHPFGDNPWQFATDEMLASCKLASKSLVRQLHKPAILERP